MPRLSDHEDVNHQATWRIDGQKTNFQFINNFNISFWFSAFIHTSHHPTPFTLKPLFTTKEWIGIDQSIHPPMYVTWRAKLRPCKALCTGKIALNRKGGRERDRQRESSFLKTCWYVPIRWEALSLTYDDDGGDDNNRTGSASVANIFQGSSPRFQYINYSRFEERKPVLATLIMVPRVDVSMTWVPFSEMWLPGSGANEMSLLLLVDL